jgi:hypothetical protein
MHPLTKLEAIFFANWLENVEKSWHNFWQHNFFTVENMLLGWGEGKTVLRVNTLSAERNC